MNRVNWSRIIRSYGNICRSWKRWVEMILM